MTRPLMSIHLTVHLWQENLLENQNCALELPSRFQHQNVSLTKHTRWNIDTKLDNPLTSRRRLRLVHNHHTLPYIRPPHALQRQRDALSSLRRGDRRSRAHSLPVSAMKIYGYADPTYRFRCIVLIAVPSNLPFESGPNMIASPAFRRPALRIPSTTVPT